VSDFPADWLARREPYDRRARNREVLAAVGKHLAASPSVTVVDLACGTGATLRAITETLPPRQTWHLVDNDLSLLARTPQAGSPEITIRTVPVDLVHDLEAALDGPVDLVTTSAFLDLVSAPWLERLVTEVAARQLPFYAALSYDGRIALEPAESGDEAIIAAFNRHQRTDKGFGPALGPAAITTATALFERIGYAIVQGRADWDLGPTDALQVEVLAGFAAAALAVGAPAAEVETWVGRRKHLLAQQRAALRVGHVDLFACPSTRR
jgi:SAM-dependent methyltransferase